MIIVAAEHDAYHANSLIATHETELAIRERENQKGRHAKLEGLPRDACPWNGGTCMAHWLEGYDSIKGAE